MTTYLTTERAVELAKKSGFEFQHTYDNYPMVARVVHEKDVHQLCEAAIQSYIDSLAEGLPEPAWYACDTEGGEFDITFVTDFDDALTAVNVTIADNPELTNGDLIAPLFTRDQLLACIAKAKGER